MILRIILSCAFLTWLGWGLATAPPDPVVDARITALAARVDTLASSYDSHRESDVGHRIGLESRISKMEAKLDTMLWLLAGIALSTGGMLLERLFNHASGRRKQTGRPPGD